MDLSIIIPAYRDTRYLHELLNSIAESMSRMPERDVEVLVIDDGSPAPVRAAVEPFGFRYHYKSNGGAAAARNLGAKLARGAFYFFLDSDTRLLGNTLQQVLDIVQTPGFAVASIPYFPVSGNTGAAQEFKGYFDAYHVWYRVPLGRIEVINGSSVVFSQEAFHALGGWDESIGGASVENEEFSVRIKRRYPIVHQPDIFVYHNFHGLSALLKTIMVRTVWWTRKWFQGRVEFDGLVRTRSKGIIALTPLAVTVSAVAAVWWGPAVLVSILGLLLFTCGNWDFYRFMKGYAGIRKTALYGGIHFLFVLAVGIGAVCGILSAWKREAAPRTLVAGA